MKIDKSLRENIKNIMNSLQIAKETGSFSESDLCVFFGNLSKKYESNSLCGKYIRSKTNDKCKTRHWHFKI